MTVSNFHNSVGLGRMLLQSEIVSRGWLDLLHKLPGRSDLITLLVRLEKLCQFRSDQEKPMLIDYEAWKALQLDLELHARIAVFLSPETFLKMPKSVDERVPILTLMTVITKTLSTEHLLASLSCFTVGDPTSQYIMSIDALEDWLYKMSQGLVQITKMTEQFVPLWVFTAAHTIAFFHGRQHASQFAVPSTSIRVNIRDFLESGTLVRLLELSRSVVPDMDSNFFSRIRAVRYYDSFTVFDGGRPDPADACTIFAGGYMSPLFLERLQGTAWDYRQFLTFAIAWDNRKSVQGVKYFWKVLDPDHSGQVTRQNVADLVRALMRILRCLPCGGPQGPQAEQVLVDEVFDIFDTQSVLTKAQALAAPEAFGTVVGILGNTQSFIEYEGREDTAHRVFLARQLAESQREKIKADAETRSGQLSMLQDLIDNSYFGSSNKARLGHATFAEFLDYHESVYGGESMEPWLAKYYLWEQAESAPMESQRQEQTSPRE